MKHVLICFLPILVGCSGSQEFSQRFQAERDLWRADRAFQKLAIAPQLVDESQWAAAAKSYEAIGETYSRIPADADSGFVGRNIRTTRTLASQAYTRAADVWLSLGDTAQAITLYEMMEADYTGLPGVVASAALALGNVKERSRKIDQALAAYRRVFEILRESSNQTIPSKMMQIPLHIARLQEGDSAAEAYAQADSFYGAIVESEPQTLNGASAQSRLVDVATDKQDWFLAGKRLEGLEEQLKVMENPPQDPADVRMAIGQTQYQGLKHLQEGVGTWKSLLRDYPRSKIAPKALMALGNHYATTGETEKALEMFSRVTEEYPNDLETGPLARLAAARLLERADRWSEANQAFKRLPIDYPLSEAALQSHIDIIVHYERVEQEEAKQQAMVDAENALSSFLGRYPTDKNILAARQRLVILYFKQERYAEGVQELLTLSQAMRGSPQGLQFLVLAAQTAETKLGEQEQAAELFEQVSDVYAGTEAARQAAAEAKRIRESL